MMYRKLLSLLLVLSGVAYAQVPISGLPPATTPLTGNEVIIVNQNKATKQTAVSNLLPLAPPLSAAYLLQTPNPLLPGSRTLVGTANEILLADGGPLGNLVLSTPQPIGIISSPTFAGLTLTGALSGTSASFSGSLTAASLALTTPLPATSGGTGFGSYAIGDLLSASTTTALSKVSDVAAGSYLRSGGVGTLPLWSTVKIPNAAALGDLWYGSAASTISSLAGNITATKQFLTQTGTGTVSAAPIWGTIAAADLPGSFSGFANPSGLVGLTAVNGVATTGDRSDSTHALDQSIAPSWSAQHIFSKVFTTNGQNADSALLLKSAGPGLTMVNTGSATDAKTWSISANTANHLSIYTSSDTGSSTFDAINITRSAQNITDISLGNATNSPTYSFLSTSLATFSGGAVFQNSIPRLVTSSNAGIGVVGSQIPMLSLANSSATANNRGWDINVDSATGSLNFELYNDALSTFIVPMSLHRSGTSVTGIALNGPTTITPAASGNTLTVGTSTISQIAEVINGLAAGQAVLQFSADAASSPLFIGQSGAANQFVTGSSNGDFGIRTQSKSILFSVDNGASAKVSISTGVALSAIGTANTNTAKFQASTTTNQSFGVEIDAGTSGTDSALLVENAAAASILFRVLGSGTILMPLLPQSSAAQTGTVCWTTGGNLTVDTTVACLASAARYKKNISNLDVGLSEIMRLRPVSYDLRDDPYQLGRQVGLIAEEVGAVDPRLMGLTGDKKQAQGVRYMQLTAVLVKAVQQQQHEIEVLAAVIAALITWNIFLTIRIRRL